MSEPPSVPPDQLASLIQAAGRREVPPQWAYDRALAAMTQTWRAKVRARRVRWMTTLAASIAAVGVAAALVVYSLGSRPHAVASVAQVERVIGAVQIQRPDATAWASLQEGAAALQESTVLRTHAASGATLRIDAVSLRIAERTELVLESRSRLSLTRGTMYIDTRSDGERGRMLVVAGPLRVTNVGTQFEVRYRAGEYRIRVREGAVLVQRGAFHRRSGAGEQISIDENGVVTSANIAANDPEWRWVQTLAPPPDIDAQPLTVLLAWVARESGVEIRYASPAIERKAAATILHGTIQRLAPLEALEIMLATTDLRHEVLSDGTILIK